MLILCLGFFVDTLFCVKWLSRLSIHDDILVLVSEFVVAVILSAGPLLRNFYWGFNCAPPGVVSKYSPGAVDCW